MWSQISSHLLSPTFITASAKQIALPRLGKVFQDRCNRSFYYLVLTKGCWRFSTNNTHFFARRLIKPYLSLFWFGSPIRKMKKYCSPSGKIWAITIPYTEIRSSKLGSTNIIDLEMYCKSIEIYWVWIFPWINLKHLKTSWITYPTNGSLYRWIASTLSKDLQ